MKQHRKLLLILAIVLSVAVAAGSTMAYLQDTDEDVNVMTLGSVHIEQLEYERVTDEGHELTNDAWVSTGETDKYGYVPDKVQPFEQEKPLLPAVFADGVIKWDDRNGSQNASGEGSHQQSWGQVGASGSNQLFDDSVKNVIDKFVFVKNTGKSDAYVRTWIALEQGSVPAEDFNKVIMTNSNKDHWSWEVVATDVEIEDTDGVASTYYVIMATYLGPKSNPTGILAPGAVSYPSLLQVYMRPEATNEDVIAIDGNKNGTYDILVFSQAVQTTGFTSAEEALNEAFGDTATIDKENVDLTVETNPIPWKLTRMGDDRPDFDAALNTADHWDGTVDTSWYNDTDTEFVLTTAEQLAGLGVLVDGGNSFEGKTVKLGNDICLGAGCPDPNDEHVADGEEPKTFDPIGDKSAFAGTFDGQGNAIDGLYQSGWALGYEWGKYGSIGLFGELESATVKNLTIAGAECFVEGGDVALIAGSATGTCVFENITIKDSVAATYNNGCGSIIGWSGAGNYTFKNITIADDVVLAGLWGSFDSSIGGVVGQGEPGATYDFENVDIACRIDAYNDCTASYDYYNYRMCGMIIGRLEETTTIDGTNYPDVTKYNIICNNVTVTYGDWMNYHYCEPTPGLNNGRGMRVEPGYAYGGLPADYDHSQCVDNHMNLIPFDQIFGGAQLGVKGLKTYDGVTVVYP
ncbi:MAG: hypothetical protein IJB69_08765 [Clostridia bacterium]|nr:hypothetical protein [Clostridia bacterium]